eukprot:4850131-Amphidinium_carterae.1
MLLLQNGWKHQSRRPEKYKAGGPKLWFLGKAVPHAMYMLCLLNGEKCAAETEDGIQHGQAVKYY